VRFAERDPPRLVVTGRTGQTLSAFGEHLTGAELEDSVAATAASLGVGVADYCVAPIFPERPGERGGHLFVVEFAPSVSEMPHPEVFARRLDIELCRVNDDYRVFRTNGAGLRAPTVVAARPNTFAHWMKARGKLGGQNKVPRILNDAELTKSLMDFASERRGR
jgi:hypothetical protein